MNKFIPIIIVIIVVIIFAAGIWFVLNQEQTREELPNGDLTVKGEENQKNPEEEPVEILVEDPKTEAGTEEGEVNVTIPNPAADFCHAQGYKYQIALNADGSKYGVCVFGETACPGWDYYQGKCQPGERPVKYISQ